MMADSLTGTPAASRQRTFPAASIRGSSRSITSSAPAAKTRIEATDERGRRWYNLRPEPRGRYDLIGFNYTWWLIWLMFILILFAPWGRGWGY